MGTATYCICEEPNCLFVQDPFFGKLFSLKEKKKLLYWRAMRGGVTAASGTGRGLVSLPSPALLTGAQVTTLLNYSQQPP